MSNHLANEAGVAIAKASPGIAVVATSMTGAVDWNEFAYMLTAAYMALQIVLLIPRYRQMFRDWRKKS